MTILVVGLGFVGLTAALGFAEKGHTVFAFDINTEKTDALVAGRLDLSEPHLADALLRNLNTRFHVLTDLTGLGTGVDAVFICVGTPCRPDGNADLRQLFGALDLLKPALEPEVFSGVVVIKSTVPPSVTKDEVIPYLQKNGITAKVVNNPEFLREGYCWEDFMNPDRIVCGMDSEIRNAETIMCAIYKDFGAPVIVTSLNTAEFIKYLSNNMLASMISFSNEMAVIAGAIGEISVRQAFEALHLDKRWAGAPIKSYVYPGCGFGGPCLPKDLRAMIACAGDYGVRPLILKSVQEVNEAMPEFFAGQLDGQLDADATEGVGILGLSFKPGSDDVRTSTAAEIISILIRKGHESIYAFDPVANTAFQKNYDFKINYCGSVDELCARVKTVIITTAWPQFAGIDKKYQNIRFIDGRYIL